MLLTWKRTLQDQNSKCGNRSHTHSNTIVKGPMSKLSSNYYFKTNNQPSNSQKTSCKILIQSLLSDLKKNLKWISKREAGSIRSGCHIEDTNKRVEHTLREYSSVSHNTISSLDNCMLFLFLKRIKSRMQLDACFLHEK